MEPTPPSPAVLALLRRGWTRGEPENACMIAGLGAIAAFVTLHGVNKLLLGDRTTLSLDADLSLSSAWTILLFVLAAVSWWSLGTTAVPATRAWPAMSGLCARWRWRASSNSTRGWRTARLDANHLFMIQPVLALAVLAFFFACYGDSRRPSATSWPRGRDTRARPARVDRERLVRLPLRAVIVALQTAEESLEMLTGRS